MPFRDFYRGKRVLVTGHTGFKGTWLALWLGELGATVAGYSLEPDTDPSLFELVGMQDACAHHVGDVRDAERLWDVFAKFEPEMVFHLAAQPLVRRSYREPKETFDVNVGGTINVLEGIQRTPSVQTAVIVTTDKVYENREWVYGYREDDPLGGHDPYSASKAAAEIAVASYSRSFFQEGAQGRRVGLASARAGNVIGGGDWAEDRIVPDAVRGIERGEPLLVRSPHSIRPWQHLLEPLGGYLALAQRLGTDRERYQGSWNFGPTSHDVVPVEGLVDRFVKTLGRGEWKDVSDNQQNAPHEAGLLRLCCDKANTVLDWRPVYETAQAVDMAALWYRDVQFLSKDARERCLEDIASYLRKADEQGFWWAK